MMQGRSDESGGHPLRFDPGADTAVPGTPGFLARPDGAPVYHGFVVLDDVAFGGFTLGMITDFLAAEVTSGDAFVVALDGSRCGLVWDTPGSPFYQPRKFAQLADFSERRWGVWAVSFPNPMTSKEYARRNLMAIVPRLRPQWQLWQARFGGS